MRDRGEKEKITGRKKGASAQGRRKNYSSVTWNHRLPPQHHRERSRASPSAQLSEIITSGNSLPPHSRRSLFIFLLAERALCTFCIQEEKLAGYCACAQ
jgi:hypothetical protein